MGVMWQKRWVGSAAGVRSAGRRAPDRSNVGRNSRSIYLASQVCLMAAISGVLLWIVWIYGNGLRDPRYLDGWVLAGGMSLQLGFHVALKTQQLSPKSAMRWRSFHIFLGYLLIAAFVSHSDFSFPDTGFEWALWACFVLVTLSGILGTYLAWALRVRHGVDEGISYNRIPSLRAALARDVQAAVAKSDTDAELFALPAPAQDAWIVDLYANHLKDFFAGQRNVAAHLIGSPRPLQRLKDEIDNLSPYVDGQNQEKLASIKALVVEKDMLDFARVYLGLTRGWLFLHVPLTYTLIVLTVLHVVVVYAFSSGDW